MTSQIMVISNPERFVSVNEGSGFSRRHKDFFEDRDSDFKFHKEQLIANIDSISKSISLQKDGQIGFLKVTLRKEAWAKKHRPIKALFSKSRATIVGGCKVGEMIFEVVPDNLDLVKEEISNAETHTNKVFDEKEKKEFAEPSRGKSETGAIETIKLFGKSDKCNFSAEEAVSWLSTSNAGGVYEVDLFHELRPESECRNLPEPERKLQETFVNGLKRLGQNIEANVHTSLNQNSSSLAIRLNRTINEPTLRLTYDRENVQSHYLPIEQNVKHHHSLLSFLTAHPLVRQIELPSIITQSDTPLFHDLIKPTSATIPKRNVGVDYPKLGIIDGGISPILSDWIIDSWNAHNIHDLDFHHGTCIGGVAVMGATLNSFKNCPEHDGAELIDIALFKKNSLYNTSASDLSRELEQAIPHIVKNHGVRVFCLSLNCESLRESYTYTGLELKLDEIAKENDIFFVISAGNVGYRKEWPVDKALAEQEWQNSKSERILPPAKSLRNISVSAINPIDLGGCEKFAPASYSRRGPGVHDTVKPDLAHIGGKGDVYDRGDTGFFSISQSGKVIGVSGTSLAAPLVAKTGAELDRQTYGRLTREALMGLLIHHAKVPEIIGKKNQKHIARHFVGFGKPPSAKEILDTDEYTSTLVFSHRLENKKHINLPFEWPSSLVNKDGKCSGYIKLTLLTTPPLDTRYGEELVRVNIEARLQQFHIGPKENKWEKKVHSIYEKNEEPESLYEFSRIKDGLKWNPTKVYERNIINGIGNTSKWRLILSSSTRAAEKFPEEGVPFSVILTISDHKSTAPVFDEMLANIRASGAICTEIRSLTKAAGI